MDTLRLLPSERIVNAGRPAGRGAAPLWVTLALTIAAIGSALYLQHPGAISGWEIWRTIMPGEQPAARLPRPRPDEPVMTGSIGRAAAAPARAGSAPATPAQSIAARIRSLEEEIELAASEAIEAEDRARLRHKAASMASAWADCDEVVGSEVLQRDGSSLVVRIDCANAVRFDLGEEEIMASMPADAPQPAAGLSDAEAVEACEAMVRRGLPYPASLHRTYASTGVARTVAGDAVVSFDFEALNGLSFPISLGAHCVFAQQGLARLEVSPR
jgi:hypothetical protein